MSNLKLPSMGEWRTYLQLTNAYNYLNETIPNWRDNPSIYEKVQEIIVSSYRDLNFLSNTCGNDVLSLLMIVNLDRSVEGELVMLTEMWNDKMTNGDPKDDYQSNN